MGSSDRVPVRAPPISSFVDGESVNRVAVRPHAWTNVQRGHGNSLYAILQWLLGTGQSSHQLVYSADRSIYRPATCPS